MEGVDAPLYWFDIEASEPHWLPVQPHANQGRPYPIRALMALGNDCVAISVDAIWRYRWSPGGRGLELIQRTQVPVMVGHHLVAAAITQRHLVLLTRRRSMVRTGAQRLQALLHGGPQRVLQIEILLLLDATTLQEIGSAAIEQTWEPSTQEGPSPKWQAIELNETHLRVDRGDQGVVQVELGEGLILDLQVRLAAIHPG
jgi:hypothetical protein